MGPVTGNGSRGHWRRCSAPQGVSREYAPPWLAVLVALPPEAHPWLRKAEELYGQASEFARQLQATGEVERLLTLSLGMALLVGVLLAVPYLKYLKYAVMPWKLFQQRRARRHDLRRKLTHWPAHRVNRINPYEHLGVVPSWRALLYTFARRSPSGHQPGYIQRGVDTDLVNALKDKHSIVVAGFPCAGKSRTVYEALRQAYPRRRILVPAPDTHQAVVEQLFGPRKPLVGLFWPRKVLWLDDLDRLFERKLLDPKSLVRCTKELKSLIVVATWNRKYLPASSAPVNPSDMATAVKACFEKRFNLPSELTDAESKRAIELYVDSSADIPPSQKPHIIEELKKGFGEHLAAERRLEGLYRHAMGAGLAVIQAAVVWRLLGIHKPIPHESLLNLGSICLKAIAGSEPTDPDHVFMDVIAYEKPLEAVEAAIETALHRIYAHSALLFRHSDTSGAVGYEPFPSLVPYAVERQGKYFQELLKQPGPATVWSFVAACADADSALRAALAARARGLPASAVPCLKKAASDTDASLAALARLVLGRIQLQLGQPGEARDMLDSIASLNVPVVQTVASLQKQYLDAPPPVGAEAPLVLPTDDALTLRFAHLGARYGLMDEAVLAFQDAFKFGPEGAATGCLLRWARYHAREQNVEYARRGFELALKFAPVRLSSRVAFESGIFLARVGFLEGAHAALKKVARGSEQEKRASNLLELIQQYQRLAMPHSSPASEHSQRAA